MALAEMEEEMQSARARAELRKKTLKEEAGDEGSGEKLNILNVLKV